MRHPLRFLLSAAVITATMSLLVGCGDDDDNPVNSKDLTEASMKGDPFAYVQTPDGTGRVIDLHDAAVDMEFNRLTRRASFDFRNIDFGDGNAVDFSFSDVDYGLGPDGESYSVSNPSLKASGALAGKSTGLYVLYCGQKTIDDKESVGVGVRVAINGEKDLTLIPRDLVWTGTTETRLTTVEDSVYVTYQTTYHLDINPTASTAILTAHNPKFAQNMPSLGDMVFDGISVSYRPGGFTLSADTIVPSIAGTPFPRYLITGLKADCDLLSTEGTLGFNCMGVFKVYATVHPNFAD